MTYGFAVVVLGRGRVVVMSMGAVVMMGMVVTTVAAMCWGTAGGLDEILGGT